MHTSSGIVGLVWTPWPLATLQAGVSKGLPVLLACLGGVGLMSDGISRARRFRLIEI